jgi:hypothetical protein
VRAAAVEQDDGGVVEEEEGGEGNDEGEGVGEWGEKGKGDDEENEEEEEDEFNASMRGPDAQIFKNWTRLITGHFRALSILQRDEMSIEVRYLLACRDPSRHEILEWGPTIEALAKRDVGGMSIDTAKTIKALQNVIDDSWRTCTDEKERRVLKLFGKSPPPKTEAKDAQRKKGASKKEANNAPSNMEEPQCGQLIFRGNLHCEALLATLMKYKPPQDDEEVNRIFKVCSQLH